MSALTKADLADTLFLELGFNKIDSRDVVDVFFQTINDFLEKGYPVKLTNLGTFDLRDKKARPGRNPKTLEFKEIASRRVVVFHAGQKLRSSIEEVAVKDDRE